MPVALETVTTVLGLLDEIQKLRRGAESSASTPEGRTQLFGQAADLINQVVGLVGGNKIEAKDIVAAHAANQTVWPVV